MPAVEPSRFDNGQRRVRATPAAPQPQGRKPGGWQYEREEQDYYDDYGGATPRYSPRRPQAASSSRAQSSTPGNWPIANGGRSYLSVDVEEDKPRRGARWALWIVTGLLMVALVGVTAFSLAWQGQYAGKVYPGVSALGIDLGGKTPDEARNLLSDKVQGFIAQPLVLTWRGKEWRPSADQIGVKVDVNSAVNQAFNVGRTSDLFSNVSQQWISAQSGYIVPVTVQFSEPVLQDYLNNIAEGEINQKLFEGDVRLDGTQIVALPGKEGRELRIYDTIEAVRKSVATLQSGKINLPVDVVQPTVSADEVAGVQQQLALRVSAPITATASGKTFTLGADALARFTTIERNPDRTASKHVTLGWNDPELKTLAEKWVSEANRPAQNARFAWNNGAVSILSESIDGFQTDADTVINSIKERSASGDKRAYNLPGKVLTPTVSSKDLPALGIKELIGQGTSTFRGSSPERATNIKVAANLLNGAVVPPGATFSFLKTMGGIDEAHGFVPGYVIAAERTVLGVGGGVCQVSTTTFRAAFWSGVQITERNQHSYRVSWYEADGEPVGFDAAVFDPGVDLQFVNNTPGYILIQAGTAAEKLTVSFYGTKPPGEVKLEGPDISNRVSAPPDVYEVDPRLPAGSKKQVETARGGLDTVITRRIVTPGQPDKVDQFRSSYQAWPNWFVVASPSQIPSGARVAPQPTPNP